MVCSKYLLFKQLQFFSMKIEVPYNEDAKCHHYEDTWCHHYKDSRHLYYEDTWCHSSEDDVFIMKILWKTLGVFIMKTLGAFIMEASNQMILPLVNHVRSQLLWRNSIPIWWKRIGKCFLTMESSIYRKHER